MNEVAFWDARYAEMPWSSEPDELLVELVSPLAPGKAVDLGAGTGRNAIWLAHQGWGVTAVDLSVVGLDQALARARSEGVDLKVVHGDIIGAGIEAGSFDLAVVANIHPLPHQRKELLGRAARMLKVGGFLFVVGHHLSSHGRTGPPDPDRLYTTQRLAEAVPGSLDVIRLDEVCAGTDDALGGRVDKAVLLWAQVNATP